MGWVADMVWLKDGFLDDRGTNLHMALAQEAYINLHLHLVYLYGKCR